VSGGCSPLASNVPAPVQDLRNSVQETETPQLLEGLPAPTLTLVATPLLADTLPANTPTPGASALLVDNRIQFPPGGTWVEINGFLEKGASKPYVLTAMGGQVMSVSITQSWPFVLVVADETQILTDPNYERPFWRGTLPATRDYFVTVKAQAAGDYTLRVAINPPGQARQYFDYVDTLHDSAFRYSDEFAPTLYTPAGGYGGRFMLTLMFINMEFLTPVTNLGEAYFVYSAMDDEETVATCTEPLSPQESIIGKVVINGYEFTQSETTDAGAGNIYHMVMYRTVYRNVCYEMVLNMHSGNIGNYPPGTVREFDQAALMAKFEEILSSFTVH
jgi:hypothetical protein